MQGVGGQGSISDGPSRCGRSAASAMASPCRRCAPLTSPCQESSRSFARSFARCELEHRSKCRARAMRRPFTGGLLREVAAAELTQSLGDQLSVSGGRARLAQHAWVFLLVNALGRGKRLSSRPLLAATLCKLRIMCCGGSCLLVAVGVFDVPCLLPLCASALFGVLVQARARVVPPPPPPPGAASSSSGGGAIARQQRLDVQRRMQEAGSRDYKSASARALWSSRP